jgi:hypothetical protein
MTPTTRECIEDAIGLLVLVVLAYPALILVFAL